MPQAPQARSSGNVDPNTGRALRDRFHQVRAGGRGQQLATGTLDELALQLVRDRGAPVTMQNVQMAREYLLGGGLGQFEQQQSTEAGIADEAIAAEAGGLSGAASAAPPVVSNAAPIPPVTPEAAPVAAPVAAPTSAPTRPPLIPSDIADMFPQPSTPSRTELVINTGLPQSSDMWRTPPRMGGSGTHDSSMPMESHPIDTREVMPPNPYADPANASYPDATRDMSQVGVGPGGEPIFWSDTQGMYTSSDAYGNLVNAPTIAEIQQLLYSAASR